MPLHFQLPVSSDTSLAVWHITEDEAFFRSRAVPQREVSHPHKRLQHLGGRYLLRHLVPDFPMELIRIADTRKPFLEDEAYHFSISHCSDFAAAIVSSSKRVGVDIEVITEKAVRIRKKFASEGEWALVLEAWQSLNGLADDGLLAAPCATLIWSCKEAVFKWYGAGEVDFKEHIQVIKCVDGGDGWIKLTVTFRKEHHLVLTVCARQLDDLWLSYVVG